MKKSILLILVITLLSITVSYGVDSTKPESHNSSWERLHGQRAKSNMSECLLCHDERNECISCHEDTAPRNHTVTFVNKSHGLESRWNKTQCQTCHREDFCDSCHDTAYPISHSRSGFRNGGNGQQGHCGTSCVLPSGSWKNTPSKNCVVCHKVRPQTQNGPHALR